MGLTKLVIRGARQHNLKNIDVEIPRNSLTVITGLSGSGKSSLAFDTIYAEGQRRYVESLSAYARQFLDQMERPEVDVIEGLSPSIAIEQKTTTRSPRSTVGTITEIYDYLRVVYASVGIPHCPNCGKPITRQSSEQIVQAILHGELCKPDDRIMILAPIVRGRKGAYRKELEKFAQDGYVRVRINGELFPLDDLPVIDKRKNHTIEIVIDRLLVKQGIATRLDQSIATALKLAGGLVTVAVVGGKEHVFSEKLACPDCGISVPQLEPRSFSFNSPYGACPACNGLGSKYDFDPSKIVVDRTRPLFDGGLGPGSPMRTGSISKLPSKSSQGVSRTCCYMVIRHRTLPRTGANPEKRRPRVKRAFASRVFTNSLKETSKNPAPIPTANGSRSTCPRLFAAPATANASAPNRSQ
jgi:excinuclease ABC subunit A